MVSAVAKKNNEYMKDKKAMPKEDVEFARDNSLDQKALRALKSHNK
jgi:hypothetical protein